MNWDLSKKKSPVDSPNSRKRSNSEPTQTVYNKTVVIIEDYMVESSPREESNLDTQFAKSNQLVSSPVSLGEELEKQIDKAPPMFDFDEEARQTERNITENDSQQSQSEYNGKEEESSDEEEGETLTRVQEPVDITGTSLPVSIPSSLRGLEAKTYIPPARTKDKDEIASASFRDDSTVHDLSKSFDVPFSLNRKLTTQVLD